MYIFTYIHDYTHADIYMYRDGNKETRSDSQLFSKLRIITDWQ